MCVGGGGGDRNILEAPFADTFNYCDEDFSSHILEPYPINAYLKYKHGKN